jgi:hypothetical protein
MPATPLALRTLPSGSLPVRLRSAVRRRPALSVALATILLAWVGLLATHRDPEPLPLAPTVAVAHLWTDPASAPVIAKLHFTRSVVTAIDRRFERVSLYNDRRLVLTAIVSASGRVAYQSAPSRQSTEYGSNIANDGRVLALLCIVFVLMTAVSPLWRLRNLDVAAAGASAAAVVLFNASMTDRMALVAWPLMLYLALRCGWRALASGSPPPLSTPLYERLTSGWAGDRRLRILRLTAFACALIVAMVGISSRGLVDVAYAVMEGGTALVHGLLPYGHIADIFHGDTYPIGSYLFYAPFAWLSPVQSQWDSADIALVVAVLAALIAGIGIYRAAGASVQRPDHVTGRRTAGLRAAIAWLTFPPLLVTISTGTTDVVLAAMLLGALLLWRRPSGSITVLAAAAWFKLAPVALLPLWLAPLRGRKLWRAVACVATVSAAMITLLIAIGGLRGLPSMVHAIGYQTTRASLNSLWGIVGSVPLQQLAQAATLGLIAGAAVRLRHDRALAADRVRVAALCGAVLLGLQMSSSYWTYMYLAWVFPMLALSVLGEPDGATLRV